MDCMGPRHFRCVRPAGATMQGWDHTPGRISREGFPAAATFPTAEPDMEGCNRRTWPACGYPGRICGPWSASGSGRREGPWKPTFLPTRRRHPGPGCRGGWRRVAAPDPAYRLRPAVVVALRLERGRAGPGRAPGPPCRFLPCPCGTPRGHLEAGHPRARGP